MNTRHLSGRELASWRFEQIEETLDVTDREERARLIKSRSKVPVVWPSGRTKRISIATLYRWLEAFQSGGLEALQTKDRADRGKIRRRLPQEVIQEALRLLTNDPTLTFSLLIVVLKATFKGTKIPVSTLQRRLGELPEYKRIKASRKQKRRRTRFVAREPHDIWHCDAKGPVSVRFVSGIEIFFHVLSIVDDASRAVLAALVVTSPNLAAAVRVFRDAALRFGLCKRFYADRASIFDSRSFRVGLAVLGAHRIRTKARNAEAHGKVEAYHRTLVKWFFDRLPHQKIADIVHLQMLLDGIIHGVYQTHYHRGIKKTPAEALAGRVSLRFIPPTRLYDAFREEKHLKAHPKTGEVEIDGVLYLVPDELRGHRLSFLIDPPSQVPPLLVHPTSGAHLSLRKATIKPEDLPSPPSDDEIERWGSGVLQTIYDDWSGKSRPVAEPGFGLPEIYALLCRISGRHVPTSDAEAARVHRVYRRHGPWTKAATEDAMRTVGRDLGTGRPIQTYLDALISRVKPATEASLKRKRT